jgi:hypothetical protein
MNNKTTMNEKLGSGKIHPITTDQHLINTDRGKNTISLDSAHISRGGDEGGSNSNRPLLSQMLEVSKTISPSVQQPRHQA